MAAKKRVGTPVRDKGLQIEAVGPNSGMKQARSVLMLALIPLLALPFMLNARMMSMVLPNEQPKWAILIVAGVLLVFAMAAQFWQRSSTGSIRFSWPGLFLGMFLMFLAAGISLGPNWAEAAVRFAFWAFALVVWLSVVMVVRTGFGYTRWLVWATGISGFIFSMHYWWDYFIEYGSPDYNISVLFSPIGQVNFTGDVLVILFPVLLWILARYRDLPLRMMCWFSTVTCGAILLIASSRGALYGLAIGAVLVSALAIRHRHLIFDRSRLVAWTLLVSALVSAVVVYELLPYHFRELARVSATFSGGEELDVDQTRPRPAPITEDQAVHQVVEATTAPVVEATVAPAAVEVKAISHATLPQPPLATLWRGLSPWIGNERMAMYASTSAMIAEKPWLGHGTGSFPYVYPKFSHAFPGFEDVLFSTELSYTTNPHNIFLQLASQNGLPAALVFMGLLALVLWRLVLSLWRSWDALTAVGLVALSAAVFAAMFNQVFFNPASMFVFALFGGLWWGRLPEMGITFLRAVPFPRFMAAVFISLALLLCIWPIRWIASDWHVEKAKRAIPNSATMDTRYRIAYRLDPYNFRTVSGLIQIDLARKDYASAIRHLEWFVKINPYYSLALDRLGVLYAREGRFDEAGHVLREAVRLMPGSEAAREHLSHLPAANR